MGRHFFSFGTICALLTFNLASAPSTFQNPGGMWMPPQISDPVHTNALNKLGLKFDPKKLSDPLSYPLGAVVSLGGCSASFVSNKGLLMTNHHCIQDALQRNTTPTEDLITDGFLAASLSEEKWAGPTKRVFVTTAFTDKTQEVLKDLDKITSDEDRYKEIQLRKKKLEEDCETNHADTKCTVASFFEGAQFYLIQQLELRDVRLVYSPHDGVGNFGGFDDNWRWPRQTGDFGFLRAYVGPGGKPADYDPQNIPYEPKHYLKIASSPLEPGDLVFVAGYPYTTQRYLTADEIEDAVNWDLPRRLSLHTEYLKVLEDMAAQSDEYKTKTHSLREGLKNYEQFYEGALKGLKDNKLVTAKKTLETKLSAWINASPSLTKKYGKVLSKMAAKRTEYLQRRAHDQALVEFIGRSSRPKFTVNREMNLLKAAYVIVRRAHEMEKAPEDRHPEYTDLKALQEQQKAFQKQLALAVDRAGMKHFMKRIARLPDKDRPECFQWVVGCNGIEKGLDALYKSTDLQLDELNIRLQLLNAKISDLLLVKDPFVKLALRIHPNFLEVEKRLNRFEGAMALLRPKYMEALLKYLGGIQAPDANATLRLTYGTVRGYRPTPSASSYDPFTTISSLLKKVTGVEPFNPPKAMVDTASESLTYGKFGPYEASFLGELPVDFLADLDITGGNSGSATLNAEGELVGLAFDGNYEAMASDWVFMPEITRSIHVDIRYILWIMDAVDGADHLIKEMGLSAHLP